MTSLAIIAGDSLALDQLLEALSDSAVVDTVKLFSASADDYEPAMYAGRPLDVRSLDALDPAAFSFLLLMPGTHQPDMIERAEASACCVLDASDVLAQRDDVPLFAGGALDRDARVLAIADAVSAHVAAVLAVVPGIRRVDLAVAQPVSSAGQTAVNALAAESARLLNGQGLEESALGAQIAFNVLPLSADVSAEIEHNLGRLLSSAEQSVEVSCQSMLAPVFYGHCVMLRVACDAPVVLSELRATLLADERFRLFPGDDGELASPAGLAESEGIDISNLTLDRQSDTVFRCAIVADNLRKGVVLNTIAALKILIKSDT